MPTQERRTRLVATIVFTLGSSHIPVIVKENASKVEGFGEFTLYYMAYHMDLLLLTNDFVYLLWKGLFICEKKNQVVCTVKV